MTLRFLIFIVTLSWATSAHATTLQVVTSLKPVHSLTAAIMGDVGTPTLLVSGGASPHTFSLKPSHAIALSRADLVVWVGPDLERFLEAPTQNLASHARSLPLMHSPGVTLLDARAGGIWGEQHEHGEPPAREHQDNEHGEHDEHESGTHDPHIWLDISNALAMTDAIEAALREIYPEHAQTFSTNAAALRIQLTNLDQEIAARTGPVAKQPYFVFHDAYQYFEKRYGLSPLGAVTTSPDIRPGARRISDLKDVGEKQERICVFAEPQFEPRLLHILTEHDGARLAYLDPLGSNIEAGPEQYAQTLRALADSLTGCLAGNQSSPQ